MKPRQADLTREAVAIMTAWVDSSDDPSFGIETLTDILQERGEGDVFRGAIEVIGGFVNLTGLLMVQRYRDTGQDERATLQRVAADLNSLV
ncbi:MAG: hypothetical protein ACJ714_14390 [Ornithinibacter sp.]|jgi:hypothetical protein